MMATGCGTARGQEMISVALGATPKVEDLTSEGQGELTLEFEAQHLLFCLLAAGLIHRPQFSDWRVAFLA